MKLSLVSGLMEKLNETPTRLRFAHLTLQEFYAASHLLEESHTLLELFKNDQETWRETVKLWCGLANDSTWLVEEIFKINPTVAFECLADALSIAPQHSRKYH